MADLNNTPVELDEADLQPIEGDEAPAEKGKSLDDVISKALDGMEGDEPAESDGRARDEKGRFAPKDSEAEAAPADDGTSDKPAVVTSTEQPPNAQAEQISEGHFRGWSPEQRAAFQALPPEAQKVALDVVKAKDAFYGDKLEQWQRFGQATEPLVNAVKPHVERIRQMTDDPSAYVAHILEMDRRLRYAPYAEKVKLLSEIAQSNGIPFAAPQPDPFADPTSAGGEAYPIIHDLRNQVTQLQQQVQSYNARIQQQQQEQTASYVRSFASQTNADGTPKYPLFEQVKGAMGKLLEAGTARTMEEAYASAVQPIEAAIKQQVAAQSRQAQLASQAALEKAKKARPVKSSGMSPGGKTKSGGLDSIISGALNSAGFN